MFHESFPIKIKIRNIQDSVAIVITSLLQFILRIKFYRKSSREQQLVVEKHKPDILEKRKP
jgi:hypothetical protein